jgi:hypothetical protein
MNFSPPLKFWFAWVLLSNLTQCTQGNNVLDAATSNIGGFLWRDTCVSSTQLNRPIWNKVSLSTPSKLWFVGSIPFKNNSILTGKKCARWSC